MIYRTEPVLVKLKRAVLRAKFFHTSSAAPTAFDYTIPGQTPGSYYVLHKPGRFKLSTVAGNVVVTPSTLPSIDVFPGGKGWLLYGGLGLATLLLLTRK